MIIDCHGHYTTAPKQLNAFRDAQVAHFDDPSLPPAKFEDISDDEIHESIENNQLKALKERGADMTIFSPRASGMGHHIGDEEMSKFWSRICNDLIHRVTQMFPDNFIGVCQLPQSPGITIRDSASFRNRATAPASISLAVLGSEWPTNDIARARKPAGAFSQKATIWSPSIAIAPRP